MATRRDGARRRTALIEAARACFAEHGVHRTRPEDVRRRAGAGPSSFYHQFSGMPALTVAVLLELLAELFERLGPAVAAATSARHAVEGLVGAHLDWVLAHPADARTLYEGLSVALPSEDQAALLAAKAELLAPLVAALAPWVARGDLPGWTPLQFDVVLLGVTHEACRRWLGGAPLEPEWMRATLPGLAWRSVVR